MPTIVRIAMALIAAVLCVGLLGSRRATAAPDVGAELRSKDPARRLAALERLIDGAGMGEGGTVSRATARRIERLLAKDARPAIRGAAARALAATAGTAGGQGAVKPLLAAVQSERDDAVAQDLVAACESVSADDLRRGLSKLAFADDDRRAACLAAEALGHLPAAAGRDDLLALLRTAPHWAVTAGACLGLGEQREAGVVDALVPRLRHPDAAVRAAARDALVRACGLDRGIQPSGWEEWWRAERATFTFPDREDDPLPAPPKPAGAGEPGAGERGTTTTSDAFAAGDRPTFARFFGIPLRGRRVCFVIDFSQSMWGARRDRAQKELIAAVKGLSSAATFGVILFNEDVWWFGDGPLAARPQRKLDLERYLPEQETKSYTNIYDALERALGLLGVGSQAIDPAPGLDEIVLLSDGVPNRGRIKDTERILAAVDALNGGRVHIHTVSLGDEELDLLPSLAAQNGGKHVRHAFPK